MVYFEIYRMREMQQRTPPGAVPCPCLESTRSVIIIITKSNVSQRLGAHRVQNAQFSRIHSPEWNHVQLLHDNYRPHLIHVLHLIQQIHHSFHHRTLSLSKEDVSFSTSGYGGSPRSRPHYSVRGLNEPW